MPYFRHVFDAEDYAAAEARVDSKPLNKHSYLGPEGQKKGALGEIAFERLLGRLGIEFKYVNTTVFDYEIYFGDRTITADVKTKARNYLLNPTFEGSIPDYVAAHQQYDYAIFTSLLNNNDPNAEFDHVLVQIGGMADQTLMLNKGYPQVAGLDGFGADGNKCKFDCHNIYFGDMVDPVDWFKHFGVRCPPTLLAP